MAGGTRATLRRIQTDDPKLERLQTSIEAAVQAGQVDITRDGRELAGTQRRGITIAAGASADIPHGLGRPARGGWPCRLLSAAAQSVHEDTAGLAAHLRATHIRLVNPAGTAATFFWWVY